MKRYPIVGAWDEDGQTWVADVPDLQAFSAHGETPVEALRELCTELESLFIAVRERGLPLPEPSAPTLAGLE